MSTATEWIIAVVAAVFLCTGHLCLGVWFGRNLGVRRTIGRARASIAAGAERFSAQRSRVAVLSDLSRSLSASCDDLGANVPPDISRDIKSLRQGLARLKHDLDASASLYRNLLDVVSSDAPRQTKKTPTEAGLAPAMPSGSMDARSPANAAKRRVSQVAADKNNPAPWQRQSGVAAEGELTGGGKRATPPDATEVAMVRAAVDRTDDARQRIVASEADDPGDGDPPPGKTWWGLTDEEIAAMRTDAATPANEGFSRRDVRYPYRVVQFAAPVYGAVFPAPEEFTPIECRDISRRGVSYFSRSEPDSEDLVITLGNRPDLRFQKIHVQSTRRTCLDGVEGVTVGCRFVARIVEGVYRWQEDQQRVVAGHTSELVENCLSAE